MKVGVLLFAVLVAVNFITIHYLLMGQSTIVSTLVLSMIAGIFGFLFSRYGMKPRNK